MGSLAGPFYASIFFICEMIIKFCLLLAWSDQNTNKGSGVIVSDLIIDGRIFTVICFNTVVLRMNTIVNFGLFLTNGFKNLKILLKNLNEYITVNLHKKVYTN